MTVSVRSIAEMRTGLALAIDVIPDLNVVAKWPELLTPPVAVVGTNLQIDYNDDTMSDRYVLAVTVYTGDQTDEGAQDRLDSHCNPAGASSVREAIERDPTLGGAVQYAEVRSLGSYGIHDYQNQRLWGAEFTVVVVAYR